MYRALLFDMDGLMIDSESIYWDVERQMARRRGIRVHDDTLRRMMGRSQMDSMRIFAADCGITQESTEELLVEREAMMIERYLKGVDPMPGLREILKRFHGTLWLAVVTSSPRKFTDVLLPSLGIAGLFEVVQTGDEIVRGKPDPEIYLRAISKLDLKASECIVLEDSHAGSLAAHRAGAYVIAVPSELTRHEDFTFVDACASSLTHAQTIIEERAGRA